MKFRLYNYKKVVKNNKELRLFTFVNGFVEFFDGLLSIVTFGYIKTSFAFIFLRFSPLVNIKPEFKLSRCVRIIKKDKPLQLYTFGHGFISIFDSLTSILSLGYYKTFFTMWFIKFFPEGERRKGK